MPVQPEPPNDHFYETHIHHNQDDQYCVGKGDLLKKFDQYDHIGNHLDVEKGDHYFKVMLIMFESGDQ